MALPTSVGEQLAAMAVHSGVRPSEILAEALGAYAPFRNFAKRSASRADDDPDALWQFFDELERHPNADAADETTLLGGT